MSSGVMKANKRNLYTQSTPATTWDIEHNMGGVPVVDVYVTINAVEQKILPAQTNIVDDNNIQLVFSVARSGVAMLVV